MKKGMTLLETLFSLAIVSILTGMIINVGTDAYAKSNDITEQSPLYKDIKAAVYEIQIEAANEGVAYVMKDFNEITENDNRITMIDGCENGEAGYQLIVKFDCDTLEDLEQYESCIENNVNYAHFDHCTQKYELRDK